MCVCKACDKCLVYLYMLFQIRLGEPLLVEVIAECWVVTSGFTCSALSCNSDGTATWLLADLRVCYILSKVISWTRILISEISCIVVLKKKMSSSEEFTKGDKISHFTLKQR